MASEERIEHPLLEYQLKRAELMASRQANALKWLLGELRRLKRRLEKGLEESKPTIPRKKLFWGGRRYTKRAELERHPMVRAAQDGLRAYSVILSSWLENELNSMLREFGAEIREGCRWDCLGCAFKQIANVPLGSLSNWEKILDVREFANRFKHRSGKASAQLVKHYPDFGFQEGSDMDYSKLDWEALTEAVAEFISAAVKALVKAAPPALMKDITQDT